MLTFICGGLAIWGMIHLLATGINRIESSWKNRVKVERNYDQMVELCAVIVISIVVYLLWNDVKLGYF